MIDHPDLPKPENYVLYNEDKDAHIDEHLMINGEEWQHLEEALQEVDQLIIDGAARKKPCLDVTGDLTDLCLATTTRSATKRQRAGGLQPSGPAKKVRWAQGNPPDISALGIPHKMQKTQAPTPAPKKRGAAPPQAPTQMCAKRRKPMVSVYNSVPSARPFKAWVGDAIVD